MIDKFGAPDRIRTHDPQIRRQEKIFESAGYSSKPGCFQPYVDQWVTNPIANYFGQPAPEKETPTTAATVTGANNSSSFGAREEQYLTGPDQATTFDIDSDTPQAVTAYVSRSTIYVIDQTLNVVAYGRLTRCGVRK